MIYLSQENLISHQARGYIVEMLLEAVAQTIHPWSGEHPCGGGRSDSLVPRPSPCGLPRSAGPAPPHHWQEGLVRDGQMSPVSPRPGDVLQPPQVSQLDLASLEFYLSDIEDVELSPRWTWPGYWQTGNWWESRLVEPGSVSLTTPALSCGATGQHRNRREF